MLVVVGEGLRGVVMVLPTHGSRVDLGNSGQRLMGPAVPSTTHLDPLLVHLHVPPTSEDAAVEYLPFLRPLGKQNIAFMKDTNHSNVVNFQICYASKLRLQRGEGRYLVQALADVLPEGLRGAGQKILHRERRVLLQQVVQRLQAHHGCVRHSNLVERFGYLQALQL